MDGHTNQYPELVTAKGSTGDVVRPVGKKGVEHRAYVVDHWRGVGESTALAFALTSQGVSIGVGLVHYAPHITSMGVREVPVGSMTARPEPWWPWFHQAQPPGPDELRVAWAKATGRLKVQTTVSVHAKFQREPGEDPQQFYGRVADTYREFDATTGKPAKWLAFAADIPLSTANRWIREARKRGLLEPAPKGGH